MGMALTDLAASLIMATARRIFLRSTITSRKMITVTAVMKNAKYFHRDLTLESAASNSGGASGPSTLVPAALLKPSATALMWSCVRMPALK